MRNWNAILTDAKERGLSRAALARELGIWRGQVNNACKDHGIDLRRANPGSGRTGPWTEAERQKRAQAFRERFSAKWEQWMREAKQKDENLNEFCIRTGTNMDLAKRMAVAFGWQFRKGPRRVARDVSI